MAVQAAVEWVALAKVAASLVAAGLVAAVAHRLAVVTGCCRQRSESMVPAQTTQVR